MGDPTAALAAASAANAATCTGGERPALADAGEPAEVEARRLIHMLGYVAMDYGGCVAGGVVTSTSRCAGELSETLSVVSICTVAMKPTTRLV